MIGVLPGPYKNVYATIKSDLRKGAARTVGTLWKLVGRSVKAIAPSECASTQARRLPRLIQINWNLLRRSRSRLASTAMLGWQPSHRGFRGSTCWLRCAEAELSQDK